MVDPALLRRLANVEDQLRQALEMLRQLRDQQKQNQQQISQIRQGASK